MKTGPSSDLFAAHREARLLCKRDAGVAQNLGGSDSGILPLCWSGRRPKKKYSSAEIGLTTGWEVKRVACSDLEASNCPVALALLNPAKPAILPIGDEHGGNGSILVIEALRMYDSSTASQGLKLYHGNPVPENDTGQALFSDSVEPKWRFY
ncbi:hypothetical protein An11g01900 [Aspergillus niger]|uniref:Uncharacterized protein n=2 Tax=Aspergillus niger TaxID=5061 RepID=A2QVM0_ASPNC|nr:hypothetical protein An11g01900 [Aspergillus niger]CAK45924.1 hypothetical protein An11g01900 [Aspergillus niger]